MKEVEMPELKHCDFCGKIARYDGRTTSGPWAYMCKKCFCLHGVRLGTGFGQKLIYTKAAKGKEMDYEQECDAFMDSCPDCIRTS